MRDGFTRKVETPEWDMKFEDFQAKWRASVVVISGAASGTEWELEISETTIGRGDTCNWKVDDDTMSKEHAAIEFSNGGLRLRDLGSMNGLLLNGVEVKAAELESGDRFQLGDHEFQLVLQERQKEPRTWVLPDDA